MWIITVVLLLAGGLLGAANLIVAKKPNAKELIDKLTPYQGWIGVALVLWTEDALAEPLEVINVFFLKGQDFVGGSTPSIADMRLAPSLEFLDMPVGQEKVVEVPLQEALVASLEALFHAFRIVAHVLVGDET